MSTFVFPSLRRLLAAVALAAMAPMTCQAQAQDQNMKFTGRLMAMAPCTLSPETAEVELNFWSVSDSYLYQHGRTQGRPITLNLLDCDISHAPPDLSITFEGTESTALPGMLMVSGEGISGIAIGLETMQGKPMPLKKKNPLGKIVEGFNQVQFQAYLQGEKSALEANAIGKGTISNTSLTFTLSYD